MLSFPRVIFIVIFYVISAWIYIVIYLANVWPNLTLYDYVSTNFDSEKLTFLYRPFLYFRYKHFILLEYIIFKCNFLQLF